MARKSGRKVGPGTFPAFVKQHYKATQAAVKRKSPNRPSCVYVGLTMSALGKKYRQEHGLPPRKSSPRRSTKKAAVKSASRTSSRKSSSRASSPKKYNLRARK